MKNLAVYQQHRQKFDFIENAMTGDSHCSEIQCTVNPNNDDLYIMMGNQLYILPSDTGLPKKECTITDYEHSKVVGLEYSFATQELYCAYNIGDIITLNIKSPNDSVTKIYERICKFHSVQHMKLSPDHEILIAITEQGMLMAIVLEFVMITEVNLYSSNFGVKQFITVGWGKKETQFHGSAGKAAAKAKPEELNTNELNESHPQISWRGDGSLFAVGFLNPSKKIREFKVFNRECILQYTSESINGLGGCLAWNPSGNIIATTQKLVNKHVVALFEKNGLKHREFLLGMDEITVKDLFWSPNSDILVVICEQPKTKSIIVQLWTEKNYHWYLKQTIVFPENKQLIHASWSTRGKYDKKELILVTLNEIISCTFIWCVNHSIGKTMNDNAVIGVIDGNKTLITGFRKAIIPPPMAHQSLQLEDQINAIVFAPNINDETSWINSNTFCTISCNNSVTFFERLVDSFEFEYKAFMSYNIECNMLNSDECISFFNMHHFLWLTKDTMLCSITANNVDRLCVLSLHEKDSCLTIEKTYDLDGAIEYIIPSPDTDVAYIIANGHTYRYRISAELDKINISFTELCYQMEVIKIKSKHVIIALSETNCFFIDGKEVAKNITSFYVHSDFLLLTTLQHTLICVPLDQSGIEQLSKYNLTVKPWENDIDKESFEGINIRRVERGSYIIAAISQDSKTILQMPRGNLECIQPRAMSLHLIGSYLNNCFYGKAFDIMRRQFVNLNLIYDYNPQQFIDNAEKFLEDLNPISLSTFLIELQNEDVTSTMYANCYLNHPVQSVMISENNEPKVTKVCKLLEEIMEKRLDSFQLIQPILISLVKSQDKQGLEKALYKIKQLMEYTSSSICITAEQALKYLQRFVDINVLYNTALGMYDFDLTKFIASRSMKDPKEYVAFLNELEEQDENYMKYSIDMHLERYESALEHISKDPTKFEKCLKLVCDQKLYVKAMKLFKKNSTEHKKVAGCYGEFLLKEKKYQEAGIMFYRSGDLDNALTAFSMSSDSWQDAITVSTEMKLSPTDLHQLYTTLVTCLKEERKYEDAATILKNYLNDAEEAVALLCEGRIWKHAIRITHDTQRLDLNETHIIPGVSEHAKYIISQLNTNKEDFLKYKSRLALLKTEKKTILTRMYGELIYNGPVSSREVTDILSETSSLADSTLSRTSRTSTASGKSYRSSKNRRKQERKFFSLKEGCMFEDLSLIYALYQIISNAYKNRDEWYQLIQVLIRFEFDEYAEKLNTEINKFFQLIESSKSEIWDKSVPTSLTEISKVSALAQHQEIMAHIKSVERYITYPPETCAIPRMSNIF